MIQSQLRFLGYEFRRGGIPRRSIFSSTGVDESNRYLLSSEATEYVATIDRSLWPTSLCPADLSPAELLFYDISPTPYFLRIETALDAFSKTGSKEQNISLLGISIIWSEEVFSASKDLPDLVLSWGIGERRQDLVAETLGYDVADIWGTSALTNCGYDSVEQSEDFRKRYSSQLNQYGLFDSVVFAEKFRDDSKVRAPEHAPFFCFLIEKFHLG